MGNEIKTASTPEQLRREAEAKVASQRATDQELTGETDAKRLLHELQVHQVELEMQNEELQQSQYALKQLLEQSAKLIEELKLAKAQAESANIANIAKRQFLANMSHEIRSPLHGIITITHLLETTNLTHEQQNYVNMLRSSGNALMQLISDILDLSKIESEKIKLDINDFDLQTEIDAVVAIHSLSAKDKGLELSSLIDPDVPLLLKGDAFRLCQIITNLLNNAIKFTTKGSVSLHIRKDAENVQQTTLRFFVRDSGIGIASDKLESIFEPFNQADNSTTRIFGGTGLGLTISRKLVEMMGGSFHVESVEGEGTTFWFEVALDKQEVEKGCNPVTADAEGLSQPMNPLGEKKRILLVEDDLGNSFAASSLLKVYGYSAEVAYNGQDALDLLEKNEYDLVLMDCSMPVLDGYETTAIIRDPSSKVKNHSMPVIGFTGLVMKEECEKCLAVGMNDYLAKPVKPSALIEMLEKWTATKPTVNNCSSE